jgi:hypothetical protein
VFKVGVMKIIGLCIIFAVASARPVFAQVTVEVTQEQQQFLPAESHEVAVRITNRSGRPLRFGTEPDWLTFSIDSREGVVVPKLADAPVMGEFLLESSKVAIKRVDITPYFSVTQPGRYEIVANVRIPEWNRDVASPPKGFNLIDGSKLWEQDVGVPGSSTNANFPPEVRKYTLQQANYLKGQIRLYVRITESSGKTLKVFPVGSIVSFSHPEPQVDKMSNLHLLYQNAPHDYSYTICDLNGELLVRQTYEYVDKRPRLRLNNEGDISVVGGVRRITENDVPPSKDDDDTSDSATPGAAGQTTNRVELVKVPKTTNGHE